MALRTFSAIIRREDKLYVAECPEIGTVSQGRSIEEALANLKEATALYIEEVDPEEAVPPMITTFALDIAHA